MPRRKFIRALEDLDATDITVTTAGTFREVNPPRELIESGSVVDLKSLWHALKNVVVTVDTYQGPEQVLARPYAGHDSVRPKTTGFWVAGIVHQ